MNPVTLYPAAQTASVRETAPLLAARTEAVPEPAAVSPRSRVDEYTPAEPPVPSGTYRREPDGDGGRNIRFDSPDAKTAKAESATYDTDRVDREIERLKKRVEELERRLDTESDPLRSEQLQKQLSQAETELSRKDNDGWRRQHADKR